MPAPLVRVGLLGCGHVGSALVQLLRDQRAHIEARAGIDLEITRIAVRSLSKDRGVEIRPDILTTDADGIVKDDQIDVVVELMGGIEPARHLIADALAAGKPVVTGNKEVVANVGDELFDLAHDREVDFLFEAAVGGGIPFIRPLRESLAGENINRVMGIVNGTTNYILSKMTDEGADYGEALADAQHLGYAERDPTADVEGHDAAAKAAIIAGVAFGGRIVAGDVYSEGISQITPTDIAFATKLGYVIKLLAICERHPSGGLAVRVHPAMLPSAHPLASVRDSYNAVFVEGAAVGELMFYGPGAGGGPTASAVLGDLIDAAVNLRRDSHATVGARSAAPLVPVDELVSEFYLNLDVFDRPGVLARVAAAFGDNGVSIRAMEQEGMGDEARLIFITHHAREGDMRATIRALRELESVDHVNSMLRVVGT